MLTQGMNFLLCTDGMTKIEESEIKKIVLTFSPQDACDELVKLTHKRGGADDVTVLVIRIEWIEQGKAQA